MALPGMYFGAVVGLLVGVMLKGQMFGYTTKAGYHAPSGRLMSKTKAVPDKALLLVGTTVAGAIAGPTLLGLVIAYPLAGLAVTGTIIYAALVRDIDNWNLFG